MWKRWEKKNVNPEELVNTVCYFFKKRDFKVRIVKSQHKYDIYVFPKIGSDITEKIKVRILWYPNTFKIEFNAGNLSRRLVLLGNLLSFFGAGMLVKRGLQNIESLENLEREFWSYMDEVLSNL